MRRLPAAALACAAVAALAAGAFASIVLRVTPRELADTANLVVEGRVTDVAVRWDLDRTCIHTWVTLDVDRVLKGRCGAQVTVKIPGGKVGDDEVRVEGTAKFREREEAVVFLWKDGTGDWLVLGEGQGKFRILRDAKGERRIVENSVAGLCLVCRPGPDGKADRKAQNCDRLAYDALVRVVEDSVRDEAARAAAATAPRPSVDGAGGSGATPAGGSAGTPTATGGDDPVSATDPAPAPATTATATPSVRSVSAPVLAGETPLYVLDLGKDRTVAVGAVLEAYAVAADGRETVHGTVKVTALREDAADARLVELREAAVPIVAGDRLRPVPPAPK